MWVECVDGNFYREPVVIGTCSGVYMTFIDVPRVIALHKNMLTRRHFEAKEGEAIDFRVNRDTVIRETATYPPHWDYVSKSWSAEIKLLSPITVPIEHKGKTLNLDNFSEAIIFGYKFPKQVLVDALRRKGCGATITPLLAKFADTKPKLLSLLRRQGYNWRELPEVVKLSL